MTVQCFCQKSEAEMAGMVFIWKSIKISQVVVQMLTGDTQSTLEAVLL
jgi:hypothetical protein